jgi:hypothetical protein
MKKRFSVVMSIILCLVLVLSLAACGGGISSSDDPYELYSVAAKKLEEPNAMSMSMSMKTDSTIGEDTLSQTVDGDIALVYNKDRTSVDFSMNLKTGTDGEVTEMIAYYKEGFLYSELMGMKLKMETPMNEAMVGIDESQVAIFAEDAIIDKKLEKISGGTKVTFVVKGDSLKDLAQDSLDSLAEYDADVNYEDAIISAVVDKKGNITSYDADLKYTVTSEDMTGNFTVKMNLSNIVTQDVKIEFPDDLDSYIDMSQYAGLGAEDAK